MSWGSIAYGDIEPVPFGEGTQLLHEVRVVFDAGDLGDQSRDHQAVLAHALTTGDDFRSRRPSRTVVVFRATQSRYRSITTERPPSGGERRPGGIEDLLRRVRRVLGRGPSKCLTDDSCGPLICARHEVAVDLQGRRRVPVTETGRLSRS